ncbi:MAG: hypothetical protein ABI333_04970 [bacterium]
MSDDRKRTRSWREIDRKKDRSAHRQDEPAPGQRPKRGQASASRSHRSTLDQLFDSGKIGELVQQRNAETGAPAKSTGASRRKLTEQIEQATSRDKKIAAIDAYLAAFSLPPDFDLLTHVLIHPDPDVVNKALDKIESLLETEKPRRARSLIAQLRTLQDLSEWGALRKRAEALLDKL